MTRKIIVSILLAVVLVGTPAAAYDGTGARTKTDDGQPVAVTDDQSDTSTTNQSDDQRSQVEQKRAKLQERLEKKLSERKEKLEGRRLAQCQNRQEMVNRLMIKSQEVGKNRLAKIQHLEEGVKAFYVKQELASDAYDTAVAVADEKEAAAVAALDVLATLKFDCSKVDGTNPSGVLKEAHHTKRQALDEYRKSVKQLFVVVREAFTAKKSASGEAGV